MAAPGEDGDVRATRVAPTMKPKRPSQGRTFLAMACALSLSSCAGTDGLDEAEGDVISQPIRGGVVDSDTTAVFAMAVRAGEDDLRLCTATLIERNLFLTARHCLVDTTRVVRCGVSDRISPHPRPKSVVR